MSWAIQQFRDHSNLSSNDLLAVLHEFESQINYLQTRVKLLEGFVIKAEPYIKTLELIDPQKKDQP